MGGYTRRYFFGVTTCPFILAGGYYPSKLKFFLKNVVHVRPFFEPDGSSLTGSPPMNSSSRHYDVYYIPLPFHC